jgi:hypothetical protein
MFVFGLLAWLHVVAIELIHPDWLPIHFSHVPFPPFNWRTDDIGIIAFAVSAFGFFIWQLEESDSKQ